MSNSSRIGWPIPDRRVNPWYEAFLSLISSMDSTAYANREDRHLMLGGDGTVSFNSGTGSFVSSADILVFSPISGFKFNISPFSLTFNDGDVLYVTVTRSPSNNQSLTAIQATSVPNTDDALVIAVRGGTSVYFRNGVRVSNGEQKNLFSGGNNPTSDIDAAGGFRRNDTVKNSASITSGTGIQTFTRQGGSNDDEGWIICTRAGSVVELGVYTDTAVTGGILRYFVQKSTDGGATFADLWGTSAAGAVTQTNASNQRRGESYQSKDTMVFAAGDIIRVRVNVATAVTGAARAYCTIAIEE